MRTVMLDKGRWRRWRIALRNEERSEGARRWWWRLLAAITSEEEREAMQTVSGNVLTAEEWMERTVGNGISGNSGAKPALRVLRGAAVGV